LLVSSFERFIRLKPWRISGRRRIVKRLSLSFPILGAYPSDHGQDESHNRADESADSSGCDKIDDVLDGGVGAVVGGFEPAVGPMLRVWPVMEAAIGERPAQALVEEGEEQRHLDAFLREALGVA